MVIGFLRKVDKIVEKLEEWLLAFGTIILTSLLLMNVILRTFFSKSIVMAEEVSRIVVLAITFNGLSYVARKGTHIRMDVIYNLLGKKFRKVTALFIGVVTSATLYYLAYVAYIYMGTIRLSNRVTASLQIPVHYITALVFLGFLTSGTQYARIAVQNLISMNKDDEEDFVGAHKK